MALVATHRRVVYCLPRQMRSSWLRIQRGTLKRLDGASPKSLTGGHGRPSPRIEARTECTHSPLP